MVKAKTAEKPSPAAVTEAPPVQLPAAMPLRLAYPPSLQEWAGLDKRDWQVLTDVIFPTATTVGAIVLAVEYCKSRKLDIMKKVVHIVPMRRKKPGTDDKYEQVDTIWPGIAEVRITATRTGIYAGKDAAVFGPLTKRTFEKRDDRKPADQQVVKAEEVEFPEWCRVDVYKIVQGVRCKFEGPKVYWDEAYATESFYSEIPNDMWKSRRSGQLEKCAEAASLRAAFPEELGGEYTAEEMHGRNIIEGSLAEQRTAEPANDGTLTPPRPQQSDFQRNEDPKAQPTAKKVEPAGSKPKGKTGPDGRPEPPPIGEAVQAEAVEGEHQGPIAAQQPVEEAQLVTEPDVEDTPPSAAYVEASRMFEEQAQKMIDVPDLDAFKRGGRATIDELQGVTEDERDMLRGTFTTMVLVEQKRRANKGKR